MRTIETTVYTFDELSDTAKEKAVSQFSDTNVDFDWWHSVYEDAERIGLKITFFDLDRNRHAKGNFIDSGSDCAFKIKNEHGKTCGTFKLAEKFLSDYDSLVEKYSDGIDKSIVSYENEYGFDNEADELETEFLKALLEEYSLMLEKEYEYLTSFDAIAETIRANGYEFTIEGNRV